MKTLPSHKMRLFFFNILVLISGSGINGQNSVLPVASAFVTNDNTSRNTIYIPHQEGFYQFKIYKKHKNRDSYDLTATITQSSSDKHNQSQIWNDETPDAKNFDYKIEAYTRTGSKVCDLKVIWQCSK